MDKKKEQRAIQYLRSFQPESEPYYLCYSGGKDSDCIRILAELAGVKHECKHNLTTVDAPETVHYVWDTIGKENVEYPEFTMWQLIVKKKIPPTRLARYCCEKLKERGGNGRVKIMGVRWAESLSRTEGHGIVTVIGKPKTMQKYAAENDVSFRFTKKGGLVLNNDNSQSRRFVEHCYRTTSTMVNPIVDWTDEDVWEFHRRYQLPHNPLYDMGYKRVGCVGCPMGDNKRELESMPEFKGLYVRAFQRYLDRRPDIVEKDFWQDGNSIYRWWVDNGRTADSNQMSLDNGGGMGGMKNE